MFTQLCSKRMLKKYSYYKNRSIFVKSAKYKPPVSNTLFTYLPINTQSVFPVNNQFIFHHKIWNYVLKLVIFISAEVSPWYQPMTCKV